MIMANQGMQMMQIYYITITADMIFVKNFTQPDFQAKNFTLRKWVICDIFFLQINSVNASNINNLGIFWF